MTEHYIFDPYTGREETILSQEGEVEGFRAGDRVEYTDACWPWLRGLKATVIGFSSDLTIWTQPDGQTGCNSTPAYAAKKALRKNP